MTRILVVDDEQVILKAFATALARHGEEFEVVGVGSGREALEALEGGAFDLMFTDLKMPGMDGLELLQQARARFPATDAVMMTGYSTVESAVGAMKYGALDYILKPFTQEELLAIVRKVERVRNSRRVQAEEAEGFVRWTRPLRVQHLIMMTTFILLTVTGVPLLFPETFRGVFFFEDSSLLRGLIHRIAAVGMILLSFVHIGWVLLSEEGNRNLRAILPKFPADLHEFRDLILYTIGKRKEHPFAGRYDVFEKFEYFAVVWGTIVMVVTGLFLWFSDYLFALVPLWVLDTMKIIHRWEAVLAILSIALWHTYHVHFKPGVFPGSKVWWNGRVTRDYMIKHHPAEYEQITGRPAHVDGAAHGEEVA